MDKRQVELTVSNRTVVRVLVLLFGSLILWRFLGSITRTLEMLLVAFFLAMAFNPAVSWLAKALRIKRRITATALAYLIVLTIFIFFTTTVIAPLLKQTVIFVRDAPRTVSNLKDDKSSTVGKFIQKHNLQDQVDGLSANISQRTRNFQQPAVQTAGRIGSALIAVATVFVLTFMMLVEGPSWIDRYFRTLPQKRRQHHKRLSIRMYDIITGYVNGQLLLALVAALFALLVLALSSTLLHVTVNAVALAGIVFVFGLIPLIGHTIGGVLVVVSCLFVSFPLAIIMAIYLIVYQQVENATLQPYIQSKFNELTPLLVFVAALLGVATAGILGAFVAIPLVGCAKIVLTDYLETRSSKN